MNVLGKCFASMWFLTFDLAEWAKAQQMEQEGRPASFLPMKLLKSAGLLIPPEQVQVNSSSGIIYFYNCSKLLLASALLQVPLQGLPCGHGLVAVVAGVGEGVGEVLALYVVDHIDYRLVHKLVADATGGHPGLISHHVGPKILRRTTLKEASQVLQTFIWSTLAS